MSTRRHKLAADASGLLTVTGVTVSAAGNRLRLDLDSGADSDGDGVPDYWETGFSFATNNPADGAADAGGEGVSNRDEYQAGTDPRNAASFLHITAAGPTSVTWQAARGFAYRLDTAASPTNWPVTGTISTAAQDIATLPVPTTNSVSFFRIATPPYPKSARCFSS